jgi:predicted permease
MKIFTHWFRSSVSDPEMDEELRAHIQLRADDLERAGVPRAEAERRAAVEFGGRERFKEECREARGGMFAGTLVRDVRFGLRVLRKSPGFTAVAVVTLALAIGANAVVFGMLNGLLLRPLDVPRASSLWGLQRRAHFGNLSYLNYRDLRDRNRSFEDLAGYAFAQVGLDTGSSTSPCWIQVVTGNYFDVLGIQPAVGRLIHPSDEHGPGSAPYIVLAWDFWQTRFGGDRGVVGRVVRVNRHPYTILGVAPPKFHGTLLFFYPDFYVPMMNQEQVQGWGDTLSKRGSASLFMAIGHLRPGVTPEQAGAELTAIGADLERRFPKEADDMNFAVVRPSLYGDFMGKPVRAFIGALMLLAGLVLLAACANLGSLFGARASDRAREVALRLALGAARSRILRQLLTEAMLVSLAGGALGLCGSVGLLRALSHWQPLSRFPIRVPVHPDASVFLTAAALALLSGILFSIVPVRLALATDPYQIVKGAGTSGAGRRVSLRELLVVAQIAMCAVLITSSAVAIRGLMRTLNAHFGCRPENVLMVDSDLHIGGYRDGRMIAMQKRMVESIEAVPGVTAAATVDNPPMAAGWNYTDLYSDRTTDYRASNALGLPLFYRVSPHYLDAAGTALLAGREFTWHDDENSPGVAMVNQHLSRSLFGSPTAALGRWLLYGSNGARAQVVGIVEDGKYTTNLAESPQMAIFVPNMQSTSSETWVVVRTARNPLDLAPAVRRSIEGLDRELPFAIRTWEKDMEAALFATRVATISLGTLGGIGTLLAVTGVFGMAAYAVSRRMRELGIRSALGATPGQTLRAALGRAAVLLMAGSAIGLALGILAAQVLGAIVYQATPRDPVVIGGAVAAMVLVGVLATWIPARRALGVDPWRLLREQ